MGTFIRQARTGDGAEILSMIVEHADHEKENFDPNGKLEHLEEWLKLENQHCTFLVIEQNEKLIGYCSFFPQFDTWYQKDYIFVDTLYLREEARGNGLGKEMMDKVFQEAEKKGLSMVQLVTPEHNEGAIKFYKRLGGRSITKEWFSFDIEHTR
jgi:ribosomal protein S18 acetylase RimI-like enzyme